MNNTYHSQNDASHLTQPTEADAAPVDPEETGNRGKPASQPVAGIQKPGPGGTFPGDESDKDSVEEYDDPDGSLDAFD